MGELRTLASLLVSVLVAACAQTSTMMGDESARARGEQAVKKVEVAKPDDEIRVSGWIESFSSRVASLSEKLNLAFWNVSIGSKAVDPASVADLEKEIRKLFSDGSRLRWLRRLSESKSIHSKLLRRQMDLLMLEFEENRVPLPVMEHLVKLSSRVEKRFGVLRVMLDGKPVSDNDIYQILAQDDDMALRKRAWEAFLEKTTELREDFIKLVRARNAAARAVGARDYFQLRLRMDEVDEQMLGDVCARLYEQTSVAFEKLSQRSKRCLAKSFGVAEDKVAPWLMDDPFSRRLVSCASVDMEPLFRRTEPVSLAQNTFDSLGFHMGSVLGRSDLLQRPGKAPGSFCIDMDRAGDVRILANVRPGRSWTSSMLHELGHVAYLIGIDKDLPWTLRRPASDFMSEAVAMISADLIYDPRWLNRFAGVSAYRLELRRGRLLAARRDQLLLSMRFYLLMIHFERELYANPDQDLTLLWWNLSQKYLGTVFPKGYAPGLWPMVVHLVQAPVYFYNYLMGRLLASQLRAFLSSSSDDPLSVIFWQNLQHKVFSKGALLSWDELIRQATGRDLDPQYFLQEILPAVRGKELHHSEEAK